MWCTFLLWTKKHDGNKNAAHGIVRKFGWNSEKVEQWHCISNVYAVVVEMEMNFMVSLRHLIVCVCFYYSSQTFFVGSFCVWFWQISKQWTRKLSEWSNSVTIYAQWLNDEANFGQSIHLSGCIRFFFTFVPIINLLSAHTDIVMSFINPLLWFLRCCEFQLFLALVFYLVRSSAIGSLFGKPRCESANVHFDFKISFICFQTLNEVFQTHCSSTGWREMENWF